MSNTSVTHLSLLISPLLTEPSTSCNFTTGQCSPGSVEKSVAVVQGQTHFSGTFSTEGPFALQAGY